VSSGLGAGLELPRSAPASPIVRRIRDPAPEPPSPDLGPAA
jgi:hypothetical protein